MPHFRSIFILLVSFGAFTLISGCSHIRMGLFLMRDNPRENVPESVAQGKTAFEVNCASCHGTNADGKGQLAPTLSAAPTDFRSPAYTKSAARIAARIAYGKGDVMPAFKEQLSEDTIWDIANYLHSIQAGQPASKS